jgi:hypothetical protein
MATMISFFGITVMSTKTRLAYRVLSNKAYALHQTIWYSDVLDEPAVKALDAELSDALSRVPASDIDSIE